MARKAKAKQKSFVMAGFIAPGLVASSFAVSLAGNAITEPRLQGFTAGQGARINRVRNDIIRDFLQTPKEFEWFWMLDADMVLPKRGLNQLLDTAESQNRRIVGGLGYIFKPNQNPPFIPSILFHPTEELLALAGSDNLTEPGMMAIINEPPHQRFIEADSTGFFCLLIHRSVLEEMDEKLGKVFNNPWIDEIEQGYGLSPKGPDVEFFERVKHSTGVTPLIDTSVQCGHTKSFVITHEMAVQTYYSDPNNVDTR